MAYGEGQSRRDELQRQKTTQLPDSTFLRVLRERVGVVLRRTVVRSGFERQ